MDVVVEHFVGTSGSQIRRIQAMEGANERDARGSNEFTVSAGAEYPYMTVLVELARPHACTTSPPMAIPGTPRRGTVETWSCLPLAPQGRRFKSMEMPSSYVRMPSKPYLSFSDSVVVCRAASPGGSSKADASRGHAWPSSG